jgi:hypothetical protein
MTKINPRWSPNMMRRSTHEAQQVYCTTGDQGSEWIAGLDDLPLPVRRRLCNSRFNICPTCVHMDACSEAAARGLRRPTIAVYIDVITAVEQKLTGGSERGGTRAQQEERRQ